MKSASLVLVLVVVLLATVTFSVVVYNGYSHTMQPKSEGTSNSPPSSSVEITSANVTSNSYFSYTTVSVKNAGATNLVGINLSVSPGQVAACGWSVLPQPTYPVYPGESIRGQCSLATEYRSGLQVTITVVGRFSDGTTSDASYQATVSA